MVYAYSSTDAIIRRLALEVDILGMSEKYDFSKISDQQKFEQLPPEEKEAVIGGALEAAQEGADERENEIQKKTEKREADELKEKEKRLLADIKIIRLYEQGLKDSDWNVRYGTVESLGSLASINLELYAKLYEQGLKDSDWNVRQGTAKSLGSLASINPELYTKLYEQGLKDSDSDVRWGTAKSLGSLASINPELAAKLYEQGLKDSDSDVRQGTAESLGSLASINPELYTKLYEQGLRDSDSAVRWGTAKSLGSLASINPELAAKLYEQGLRDSDWNVRRGTAKSLGSLASINPELYTKLYEQGLKDSDSDVRWGTAKSLGSYWENQTPINLNEEEIQKLLAKGGNDTAYAVGYFYGDKAPARENIPEHTKKGLEFGMLERERQLSGADEEYKKRLFETAKEARAQGLTRTLAKGLEFQDYETVSNFLLGELKQAKDESTSIRYLKTVIEIENPKARTMAANLFANRELPRRYRRYLAEKLINEGHWDKNLGPYLKDKDENEADEILTSLISKLGLNPDLAAYQALEAPGLLAGETISERIEELKEHKSKFEEYDLAGLRNALKDDDARKIFYLIKGGEYRYTLINDYSFDKFSLVFKKVLEQEIDDERLKEFKKSLLKAGRSEDEAKKIIGEFLEGRTPIMDQEKRNISFFADVELGGEYEENLVRLQSVLGQELESLIYAGFQEEIPSNMEEAKNIQKTESKKGGQIKEFLEAGKKHDFDTVKKIAEKCKKELIFRARQKGGDKEAVEELERLNVSGLLHKYLTVNLPKLFKSPLISEWQSHLNETLTKLEAGRGAKKSIKKELELTFLDKGKDFIRTLRFADGQQCCFNSKNYDIQGGQGASDWIARLNADPLSFIFDIKTKDSNVISGFIFGRMGVSPKTQKPIIMLNGVYSQEKGKIVNDNILRIVEEQFAKRIGASAIVMASKHGGSLSEMPSGYEKVADEKIIAIRALENNDAIYDDIGSVANGEFLFDGYEKEMS